jgi:hypothetical protein
MGLARLSHSMAIHLNELPQRRALDLFSAEKHGQKIPGNGKTNLFALGTTKRSTENAFFCDCNGLCHFELFRFP